MSDTAPPKVLTRAEAGAMLRVHPATVRRYEERGLLRTIKYPGTNKVFVTRESVEALLRPTA